MQDGLTSGAIYALLAIALVLVFTVTRVIFIPQGDFIAYSALSLSVLQAGALPGTVYLLLGAGACAAVLDTVAAFRQRRWRTLPRIVVLNIAVPVAIAGLAWWTAESKPALWIQVLTAIMLVVPLGPLLYRLAFQRLADASVLVLLVVAVAVHYALSGLALVFFGGEGLRSASFSETQYTFGVLKVPAQSVWILGVGLCVIVGLWLFFERSVHGKALRATAINRIGARLVGIPVAVSGSLAFSLATFIGAVSGVLISPVITMYYDTGFLIGLKGFVGAILAGLASYPLAAIGSLLVGIIEAFSSFWVSPFKEVAVFTLIIVILVGRSVLLRHAENEKD